MSVSKAKRTKKVSAGVHGAKKSPLSEVAKALLGKGLVRSTKPADCNGWMGVGEIRGPVFDKEQASLNRTLYPHLFAPQKRGRR